MTARASFDRLRMRTIETGIWLGPQRLDLILSLSKDAQMHVHRLGNRMRASHKARVFRRA